jgi:hypothetical protein
MIRCRRPQRAETGRMEGQLGPSLCEKSHRQKERRIIFFVVFSRRQLLAVRFQPTKSRRKF